MRTTQEMRRRSLNKIKKKLARTDASTSECRGRASCARNSWKESDSSTKLASGGGSKKKGFHIKNNSQRVRLFGHIRWKRKGHSRSGSPGGGAQSEAQYSVDWQKRRAPCWRGGGRVTGFWSPQRIRLGQHHKGKGIMHVNEGHGDLQPTKEKTTHKIHQ